MAAKLRDESEWTCRGHFATSSARLVCTETTARTHRPGTCISQPSGGARRAKDASGRPAQRGGVGRNAERDSVVSIQRVERFQNCIGECRDLDGFTGRQRSLPVALTMRAGAGRARIRRISMARHRRIEEHIQLGRAVARHWRSMPVQVVAACGEGRPGIARKNEEQTQPQQTAACDKLTRPVASPDHVACQTWDTELAVNVYGISPLLLEHFRRFETESCGLAGSG